MARPIPVYLVDYDPNWPEMANGHINRLLTLAPLVIRVHHIGSTSIPEMRAKPVIDLMPLVSSIDEFDQRAGEFGSLGYINHGEFGVEGRRFCTFDDPDTGGRIAQLHCYESGSPHARRQLAFRDYLRAHPNIAHAYEAEKKRASSLFPDNSVEYSREKGEFIRAAEAKALAWVGDKDIL